MRFVVHIPRDGNCFFAMLAFWLRVHRGVRWSPDQMRAVLKAWVKNADNAALVRRVLPMVHFQLAEGTTLTQVFDGSYDEPNGDLWLPIGAIYLLKVWNIYLQSEDGPKPAGLDDSDEFFRIQLPKGTVSECAYYRLSGQHFDAVDVEKVVPPQLREEYEMAYEAFEAERQESTVGKLPEALAGIPAEELAEQERLMAQAEEAKRLKQEEDDAALAAQLAAKFQAEEAEMRQQVEEDAKLAAQLAAE